MTDVVVVAFGSANRLVALLPQLAAEPGTGRIIVVDHGDDGSSALAESLGCWGIANPTNPGFGAGQNMGVARTTTPFVLLINPDLTVEPGFLAEARAFMDRNPQAGAVQGAIFSEESGTPERSGGRTLGPVHLWGRLLHLRGLLTFRLVRRLVRLVPPLADHVDRVPDQPTPVETLAATMLLVRRRAFDDIGGFDTGFFLYGEDLDLCHRLRAAGWELWSLPSVWARHASGESSQHGWDRELVWWEGTLRHASLHWSRGAFGLGYAAGMVRALTLAITRPSRGLEVVERLVSAPLRSSQVR